MSYPAVSRQTAPAATTKVSLGSVLEGLVTRQKFACRMSQHPSTLLPDGWTGHSRRGFLAISHNLNLNVQPYTEVNNYETNHMGSLDVGGGVGDCC